MTAAALARCEVVATSSAIARRPLAERSGVPTLFVPPAVDPAAFNTAARAAGRTSGTSGTSGTPRAAATGAPFFGVLPDGSPRDRPVLLYTARFEPRKNHAMLFDAMRDGGWTLILLDGGTWAGDALPGYVRIVAPRSITDVAAWTAAADVAVFPSQNEGFGIPMLEALACGTPLIAADTPAARWLTGNGRAARLLPAHDPEAWRRAIAATVSGADAAQTDRVRAGVRRAAGFSWARSAARLLAAALP
jgi:glycosyltransferase involved in cell wall biosynthesis